MIATSTTSVQLKWCVLLPIAIRLWFDGLFWCSCCYAIIKFGARVNFCLVFSLVLFLNKICAHTQLLTHKSCGVRFVIFFNIFFYHSVFCSPQRNCSMVATLNRKKRFVASLIFSFWTRLRPSHFLHFKRHRANYWHSSCMDIHHRRFIFFFSKTGKGKPEFHGGLYQLNLKTNWGLRMKCTGLWPPATPDLRIFLRFVNLHALSSASITSLSSYHFLLHFSSWGLLIYTAFAICSQ